MESVTGKQGRERLVWEKHFTVSLAMSHGQQGVFLTHPSKDLPGRSSSEGVLLRGPMCGGNHPGLETQTPGPALPQVSL